VTTWSLQDAKARFSAVVDRAVEEGPQIITRHGHEVAVLMSAKEFRERDSRPGLKSFLLEYRRRFDVDLSADRHGPREDQF
jgi:prevent-host-death family protein